MYFRRSRYKSKRLQKHCVSVAYSLCFILCLCGLYSVFCWTESSRNVQRLSSRVMSTLHKIFAHPTIKVLFWTGYYQQSSLLLIPFDIVTSQGEDYRSIQCKDISCEFTNSKNRIDESDAVIFHARNLFRAIERNDSVIIPAFKRTNQPWIFYTRESPANTLLDLTLFPDVFNWTMTYRSDSDIPFPYGKVILKSPSSSMEESNVPWREYLRSLHKARPVAWTVSNCNATSKRDDLVDELQKFIPVDIYGLCGNFTCQKPNYFSANIEGCHDELHKKYKFYLSFENSLCDEYVTEKFFNALDSWMVPVVYGNADYTKIAPHNSFIDVRSFSSIEQLGNYLLRLDANQEEYEEYFVWRGKSEVAFTEYDVWCDVCEKVSEGKKLGWRNRKWYSDIHKWFFGAVSTTNSQSQFNREEHVSPNSSLMNEFIVEVLPSNEETFTEGCVEPPFDL